jgi:glucose/mannose-6-phosphate isomerase
MLEQGKLEKFDKQKMYQVYNNWPQIALECYNTNLKKLNLKKSDHIVFAGMGGSGAVCDIFSAILSKTGIHTEVIKGYHLPKTVDFETLLIITSVSGDTEETMSMLKAANKITKQVVCFSSGGKIEEFCSENNIEYRKIPMEHSPRASFVSYLYSMLKILEYILPIEKKDVIESINELKKTQKIISNNNLNSTNTALNLANWIHGIPLIYYPWGLQEAAIRFKNSLQENAKCHAMIEDIIETCHNGIVSWGKNQNVDPILIQGMDDHHKTTERWEILRRFFDHKDIEYMEIQSVKGNILSKLINLTYLLDYASIYLAVINEIDPTPVESIKWIKEELRKNQ